ADLDRLIEEKSRNWSVSRMARVDLNILRVATYELLHRPDVPRNVTLNEAVEIAKTFGAEESPAFVNGILDELAKAIPETETAP
ncbi:MAG TPA: transcription antitermination factor NusB, partial [Verrucomicrobiae bacterium]|nr:transcription antitermination factor NusB [Verrucomicrobiae bacterium]